MGLIQFITEQNQRDAIRDFAAQQYGQSNPMLAAYAQADPEGFTRLVPSLVQKDLETQAIKQFYGGGQQDQAQQQQVAPQGMPQDLDAVLSQQNQPLAQQQPNQDVISRYTAFANLPKELQTLAGPQLAVGSFGGQGAGGGVSGDEFLKTLPSALANQVKAMDEGRLPFTSMSARSPQMQALLQYTQQYDPEFDASTWQQRSKTAQDFNSTGGKSRQNIVAIETAINHLAALKDASQKLGGWGVANALIRNPIMDATSDPRLTAYNTIAKTAADEVAKATAGPGGSTQADREERMKEFTAGQSPDARNAAYQSAIKLLEGRLEPLAESYNNAMGTAKRPTELMSPVAQAAYANVMGQDAPNVTASGNYQPSTAAPQNPILQATQQQPQMIRNSKTGETAMLGQDGGYYTRDGKRIK